MEKPDSTSIRKETKKILKMRAAYHGLSLVDYLENILNLYFDETDKGRIDELERLAEFEKKRKDDN